MLSLALFLAFVPQDASQTLADVVQEEWEFRLRENPLLATAVGVHDFDDQLPALGPSDVDSRHAANQRFLAMLDSIHAELLPPQDRITRDLLRTQLQEQIADHRFGAHQIPFNSDSGFFSDFGGIAKEMPLRTAEDHERYLERLACWPRYLDEQIAWMRKGLARGMTQPRLVASQVPDRLRPFLVGNLEESAFFTPFLALPESWSADRRQALLARAREVVSEAVLPAYARLLEFFEQEYIPGARESLGASGLPDGAEYYQHQIRVYTTLDQSPQEIHELGRREVARIRAEMEAIVRAVGFEGTFREFLDHLRSAPDQYATSAEDLLKEAAWITKRMEAKLPSLFRVLPRLPLAVEPVPAAIAPHYTAGRYSPAAPGSTQPGHYWVNTHALDTRPLYNLEALSLHEGVPGHHLQIALAQELEGLPPFRRELYHSAYGEGWALYAEWLGKEAGFYKDPYRDFGRLTYEMWRACRLVVDTGVHAMGWTREQMVELLRDNTALSEHEIQSETDRYISWPAQALSYKIGELTIRRLRREAEQALGGRFDVRDFHHAVLENGSVPLTLLEQHVREWMKSGR